MPATWRGTTGDEEPADDDGKQREIFCYNFYIFCFEKELCANNNGPFSVLILLMVEADNLIKII